MYSSNSEPLKCGPGFRWLVRTKQVVGSLTCMCQRYDKDGTLVSEVGDKGACVFLVLIVFLEFRIL